MIFYQTRLACRIADAHNFLLLRSLNATGKYPTWTLIDGMFFGEAKNSLSTCSR
jgi:hypothetical protein